MNENNLELCRFCQRNVKLSYYCESCGASCCTECLDEDKFDYYVCQDCESKNIINVEGKRKCKDCGNDNVIKISQHLNSCPKCHSNQIINIYEKREELEQRFLELVKDTRKFIQPLRDIINKLYILRQKVKQARAPPVRCFHYPRMENELLDLFKLMIYIKNNLRERIGIHFQHLGLSKEYYLDIHTQPNSNIRIIEGILDNLFRSCETINDFIQNNLVSLNEGVEKIQENLKFIEKIDTIFSKYKRFLNLAEKEKPVYAIRCKLSNGLNTQDSFKKDKGILFITNLDLSFIHEHGLFKKKQEKIFKAPVADLTKITEKGTLFKKLYVEYSYGKYEFSLSSEDIPMVIDYILLARTFDENVVYDELSAKRLAEINLELNDLTNFIEKGIISFFNLKCQYNKTHSDTTSDSYRHLERRRTYADIPQMQENHCNYSCAQNQSSQAHNHYSENYNENGSNSGLFPQDNFRMNRFQNYNPQGNYPENQGYATYRRNHLTPDEKLILMKQLEKANKMNHGYPQPGMNANLNKDFHIHSGYNSHNLNGNPNPSNFAEIFEDKHLSDFFENRREPRETSSSSFEQPSYQNTENKRQRLTDLKREHYGLKQTLKQLENKFDQGIISEVDYFRTYKRLQKELYIAEKKISHLKDNLKEEQKIRNSYDPGPFFT